MPGGAYRFRSRSLERLPLRPEVGLCPLLRRSMAFGANAIGAETEASIRPLTKGDMGMRKVTVQIGVATGTVQRIAKGLATSIAA
jgi:hypothetical protein